MNPRRPDRPTAFRFLLPFALAVLTCSAHAVVAPAVVGVRTVRALAQQGLAIALASNVLQSHILYVEVALGDFDVLDGTCYPLDETDLHAGGLTATAPPNVADGTIPPIFHVDIYYDGDCTTPYMNADVVLTESDGPDGTTYSVSNLENRYVGVDGVTPLATLTTTASLTYNDEALTLHGLGAFVGAPGTGATASLGLVCAATASASALDCAGGIVQTFASLDASIGSVSPLTLTPSSTDESVDFASTTPAAISIGAPGALDLHYGDATDQTLVIDGGSEEGSDEVSGHVAAFSLLPPPPTYWSADDTAHGLHFAIEVVDADTRALDVSITQVTNGASLASGHLDQSGTGSITFSDGSAVAVTSWIMSDAASDPIFSNGFDLN